MDAPFVILLVSIALTVKVIFPEVVTGELPTVNSEDPPSAIPILIQYQYIEVEPEKM